MNYVAVANDYIKGILSGEILACKSVKQACQRQVNDLGKQGDPTWPYRFDEEKANRICRFLEQAPHIEGSLRGKKLRLEPWQCFLMTTVFGWVRISNGKRRFRRAYTEVPRGNGKSAVSSPIGVYMMRMDDEGGAQVYSAATTRDQAKVVFGIAQKMVRKMPDFCERFGVEVAANSIHHVDSASFFRALSAEANTLDGLNIHCAIVDELHAHPTREVFDVLETGLGKRDQSLMWIITTAGSNRAGICFEIHTYVLKILEGTITDESFFGIIYTIDDEDDWTHPDSWRKANPNWGVSVYPDDISQKAHKALQLASAAPAFKTKHLNIWVNADSAWMNMQKWAACYTADLKIEDFTGDECILGLDLASRGDLAAFLKLYRRFEEDEQWHYYAFGDYWLPEDTIEESPNSQYVGWATEEFLHAVSGAANDFDLIEEHIKEFADTTNVKELAYDQAMMGAMVTHFQEEFGEEKVIQHSPRWYNVAMKELESLINEKRFHHDGNPVLTWAISNVVAHRDSKDHLYPRKQTPENKIDPAVALLMALYRWTAYSEDDSTPTISFFG